MMEAHRKRQAGPAGSLGGISQHCNGSTRRSRKNGAEARNAYPADVSDVLDFTQHIGSLASTQELIESCHIGEGAYVLDVGCGVGSTSCYIRAYMKKALIRPKSLIEYLGYGIYSGRK